MKMIQEHQEARNLLQDVGVTAELNDVMLSKMKMFVIRYIYNDKTSLSPSDSRAYLWGQMQREIYIFFFQHLTTIFNNRMLHLPLQNDI